MLYFFSFPFFNQLNMGYLNSDLFALGSTLPVPLFLLLTSIEIASSIIALTVALAALKAV